MRLPVVAHVKNWCRRDHVELFRAGRDDVCAAYKASSFDVLLKKSSRYDHYHLALLRKFHVDFDNTVSFHCK